MLQSSGLPSFLSMFVYTNHTCLLPSNKKIVTGLTTPSSLYAGLPACRLVCLDRVLRSAARLIGGIPKFGHVSKYMLDVLRWLPTEQRISYRIPAMVWRSLLGIASLYLRELCYPLHSAMSSRSL